ncbi:nitrogenase component 1 [[Clostridium] polysaccharolyticum]|uniref:Nitrogenase molybdenum-iron protein beta chain n=1 Tax=[Clostridium] polysaccharolyticum TaxID=29364 RepID=A0A1I0BVQ3_9FIRM|nr:nitrogenase component 1 [[Clostridium] polysaccharolyticum]SET11159.1 nitrogenase molybdenum-iron protein beta chain [[Clostridium] polysaccharolyticum]
MAVIERPRFSCMLGGALATLSFLPGVVPIIHGAQGCGGGLFGAYTLGGRLGTGYCGGTGIPSSNIGEKEIIFGGAERLKTQIENTLDVMKGKLYVVVSACMADIIGEDIEGVINQIENKEKASIIYIDTGGFQGKAYDGYDIVFQELFRQYIPKREKKKNLVNLFGEVPGYDPYFRGNLEEIKRILGEIGLEVNQFLTPGETHENLLSAGSAALNIVLSPVHGIKIVQTAKKTHDIDYLVEPLPVGAIATERFIRKVAERLELDSEKVEKVVKNEKKKYYTYFEQVTDYITDTDVQSYGIVIANSTDALSYAEYLENEIGFIPKYIFITDFLSESEKAQVEEAYFKLAFGEPPELVFEMETKAIERYVTQRHHFGEADEYVETLYPLIILGSSIDTQLANKLEGDLLPISYPCYPAVLNKGYAGFRGGNTLFEDILNLQQKREVKVIVQE